MARSLMIVMLAILATVSAQPSESDWVWRFNGACFGTAMDALEDVDTRDSLITGTQAWYTGVYHEQYTAGWTGDTGFYSQDFRAPLLQSPGPSKTWVFYLWEDPSWNIVLELGWGTPGVWGPAYIPSFHNREYRLTYVRAADGITGGSVPVGTSILLNQQMQGTWSFPVYRTTDGRTGYMFELTATVIPEPSSLLALGGGLIGLAGLALRRRRR